MKRLKRGLGLFALSLVFNLTNCKKDNSTTAPSCGSGLLCATIDGNSYTALPFNSSTGFFGNSTFNGSYAVLTGSSTSTGGYYLSVIGNNGSAGNNATQQIDLTITQLPVAGGTYSTQGGSASFNYYTGTGGNKEQYLTDGTHTGTVTITSIDTINNSVSGTYSFTGTEAPGQNYTPTQHTITDGSFTKLIMRR